MNWEKSKALTPLKHDFLRSFFAETQTFYLTGGSALGIFYLQHRLSYDLDFFTQEEVNWHLLSNMLMKIAGEISAELSNKTASPLFYRFELTRGDAHEILDFVLEQVPQLDLEKEQFDDIRVDTLREIAANKVCMMVSRSELKDLLDLYFLDKAGVDLIGLIPAAQRKEGGLEPAMLSHLLSQVELDLAPHYLLQPVSSDELRQFVEELRRKLAELAFPG